MGAKESGHNHSAIAEADIWNEPPGTRSQSRYGKVAPSMNSLRTVFQSIAHIVAVFLLSLFWAPCELLAEDLNLRHLGDVMQIVLPLAAGNCALRNHDENDFAVGFVTQSLTVLGIKNTLGNQSLSQRPDGSGHGFPSGHTAAAMYGATSLAKKCAPENKSLAFWAYGAAVLTGYSRIDADRHDLTQVVAGLLVGYFANGFSLSAQPKGLRLDFHLDF